MALQGQQANLNQQKAEGAANLASNAGDLLGTVTMGAGMNDAKPTVSSGGVPGRTELQQYKLKNLGQ